jgi:hypothetical protein
VKKRRKKLVASKGNKEGKLAKKVGEKNWQKRVGKKSALWRYWLRGTSPDGPRQPYWPCHCTQEKVGKR